MMQLNKAYALNKVTTEIGSQQSLSKVVELVYSILIRSGTGLRSPALSHGGPALVGYPLLERICRLLHLMASWQQGLAPQMIAILHCCRVYPSQPDYLEYPLKCEIGIYKKWVKITSSFLLGYTATYYGDLDSIYKGHSYAC